MDLQVVAIKALQLLCCLSLLVVLHEFGHYGFSKLFRVKVEKFYMFFNPKFHLFSTRDKWFTRLFPYFKNNETEYGIGWLPLGGYVKISGMVDESMDTEQMKQPAQPWEFRSQKVWKRFFIMAGGVIMNLITAWVIYSAVLFTWGHEYIPMRNITDGFQFNEYAQSLGFRNGDIPVAADGDSIIELSVSNLRTISNASVVTVLRGGEEVQLNMPEEGLNMLEMLEMEPAFMAPVAPIVVDTVMPGSPAEKVGMRSGSRICSIDGIGLETWGDFDEKIYLRRRDVLESPECTNADSLRLRTMAVVFVNPGMEPDSCVMELGSDYMMGVVRGVPGIKPAYKEYTLLSSIPAGLKFGW
ncbi:MAG: site-2 protease family protein, partial [Bacteroidaceae bacterium]|nr:site-2 protease family protein [Bacteroidaceae bacterium]